MTFEAAIGALSLVINGAHKVAEMTGALDDKSRKRVADAARGEIQQAIDLLSAIQRGERIDAETIIPPGLDKILSEMGGQDVIDAATADSDGG